MSIDAMKQALAALEEIADEVFSPYDNKLGDAILALRAAIEEAEKPWVKTYTGGTPHYTTPDEQPRQWQGLTKKEFLAAVDGLEDLEDCWVAVEAKLKEKNT